MRAGENIVRIDEGSEVPKGSRLIGIEEVFSHHEYEDENDYHFMQTPMIFKVYKKVYIYEVGGGE